MSIEFKGEFDFDTAFKQQNQQDLAEEAARAAQPAARSAKKGDYKLQVDKGEVGPDKREWSRQPDRYLGHYEATLFKDGQKVGKVFFDASHVEIREPARNFKTGETLTNPDGTAKTVLDQAAQLYYQAAVALGIKVNSEEEVKAVYRGIGESPFMAFVTEVFIVEDADTVKQYAERFSVTAPKINDKGKAYIRPKTDAQRDFLVGRGIKGYNDVRSLKPLA